MKEMNETFNERYIKSCVDPSIKYDLRMKLDAGIIFSTSHLTLCDICFQVMTRKNNRQMSFSWYIASLAVSDSVSLIIGL